MKAKNFSRQIPKNLFVNLLSFASTILIGLWLTPYLLKHVGIVAYGLIPLAMFFSQYVSVIINAINMSINRFLLIALQKHDDKTANEIFNTALIILLVFILLQSIVMIWILFNLNTFFTIPPDLFTDALWLFGLTYAGFSVSLLRSVFGTSMFAYNRLDILRMIDIVQNIVRLIVIVLLFSYDAPSLKYVGIANFITALSAVVPTLYYFKQYTPQLLVNFHSFSKKRVLELSHMSVWVLVNQVGVLLLGNIDLYLVNKWLGAKATGEYAIVLQFTSIFKTFLTLLAGVLSPVFIIYYANNTIGKLRQFTVLTSKIMVIVLIVPLSLLVAFSEQILHLWLGEGYAYLHDLVMYALLYFVVLIPVILLFNITISYNRVKLPGLLAVGFGILNIVCIYFLINQTDLGLWSVIIVKLLFEVIFSLFILVYVSNLLDMEWKRLFGVYISSIMSFVILIYLIIKIDNLMKIESIFDLVMFGIVCCMILIPLLYTLLVSKEEKFLLSDKYPFLRKIGL